jgi:hypothetical protein
MLLSMFGDRLGERLGGSLGERLGERSGERLGKRLGERLYIYIKFHCHIINITTSMIRCTMMEDAPGS